MYRMIGSFPALACGALLGAAGCAQGTPGRAGGETSSAGTTPVAASQSSAVAEGDQPRIARLEREARAIARTTGCQSLSACRTAPVGARSCGGPRTYLVYCAAGTDTVALFRKLHELEVAEKAYNEKSGLMSTCEMRLPPSTMLDAGSCREGSGASVPR